MKKLIFLVFVIVLSQVQSWAGSCTLSSYESRNAYDYSGARLICDYQNGVLRSRFLNNYTAGETPSIDYYPNGMPREYNFRGRNIGGGFYSENKKYNSSGMLISRSVLSGSSGYECSYVGRYRLRCLDYNSGDNYEESVEYVSQYEGN